MTGGDKKFLESDLNLEKLISVSERFDLEVYGEKLKEIIESNLEITIPKPNNENEITYLERVAEENGIDTGEILNEFLDEIKDKETQD